MPDPASEKEYNSSTSDDSSRADSRAAAEVFERPRGFKGIYSHPVTQVAMLGMVCFMCPGLYNSLGGIGGGGQIDERTAANANVAVYSTFSAMAFFAGSVNNKLGSRLTLQLGSLGYGLYIASFLSLNIHPGAKAFVITAGAILGICAGLLWTAQGSLMLAYPTEGDKAKFITVFWAIFNMGGVVGSAVAFGQNFHTTAGSVNNGTYIIFLVLTIIGACIPLFMIDPKNMIRTDGTKLTVPRNPSWKVEILGLYVALKTDPLIILLFPMFLASNWFYTWQFNEFNGALFNIRTRSLNSMLYWCAQIFGSLIMSLILDMKHVRRRVRAFTGWGVVFVMVLVVHIWAYEYQKDYTRASIAAIAPEDKIDFSDKQYVGRVFLYIFCGLLDAMWQTSVYWMMGAMSNDPSKLAYFTGFYKSIQSAGAAGVWRADAILIHERVRIYMGPDHTNFEDEVVARMDDDGNILPTEVAAQQLGFNERKTEA
ncbi:MFS general substrate transporter [Mycena maculata]|uniref:MFS general substrate transporter n=1 Tax=Mycena maculata TaxID=230809 RepID=A0AAD7I1C6_9AGAR|nr:MFS general substrate transporter [Mycena maculata]